MKLPTRLRTLLSGGFTVLVLATTVTIPKVLSAEQGAGLTILQGSSSLISSIDATPALRIIGILPPTVAVYSDTLHGAWQNWSWGISTSFDSSNSQVAQSRFITAMPNAPWSGFYLHTDNAIPSAAYPYLRFYAKGSQDDQHYSVSFRDVSNNQIGDALPLDDFGGLPSATSWKLYLIPLATFHIQNAQITGFVIQDTTGIMQPAVYFDDIAFIIGEQPKVLSTPKSMPLSSSASVGTSSALPTLVPSVSVSQSFIAQSGIVGTGFEVKNNTVYQNGTKITLHGVNWFGAETENHVPHGLLTRNYKDMISQIKRLGFNAVRLPVCPTSLRDAQVSGVDFTKNPDLAGLSSNAILDKIISELNAQQIYILLDHHRPDCQSISPLWYTGSYSAEQWILDLQSMASHYRNTPFFIGIDLKNEPHDMATWGTNNPSTDWNTAAETAGQAVFKTNPNLLIFIQGIQGDTSACSSSTAHWWGGNFEPLACTPVNTTKIPATHLVLSPHIYGPDVYARDYFNAPDFPANMPSIWDKQFGFASSNYTIIPGEWGGKFQDNGGSSKDPILQKALVIYFQSRHICSSFYWDWNPNSGDTGGILQDDWQTPWQNKLDLIHNYYANCQ